MEKELKLLIPYYEKAIKDLESMTSSDDWKKYIKNHYVGWGICLTFYSFYREQISDKFWVTMHCSEDGIFWFKPTWSAKSKEEAISLLEMRLSLMKYILKHPLKIRITYLWKSIFLK